MFQQVTWSGTPTDNLLRKNSSSREGKGGKKSQAFHHLTKQISNFLLWSNSLPEGLKCIKPVSLRAILQTWLLSKFTQIIPAAIFKLIIIIINLLSTCSPVAAITCEVSLCSLLCVCTGWARCHRRGLLTVPAAVWRGAPPFLEAPHPQSFTFFFSIACLDELHQPHVTSLWEGWWLWTTNLHLPHL